MLISLYVNFSKNKSIYKSVNFICCVNKLTFMPTHFNKHTKSTQKLRCVDNIFTRSIFLNSNFERNPVFLPPGLLRIPFPARLIIFPFTFCPNSKLPILWIAKQPRRGWGVERGDAKIERDLCKHNHVLKWKCGALNKSYISPVPVA